MFIGNHGGGGHGEAFHLAAPALDPLPVEVHMIIEDFQPVHQERLVEVGDGGHPQVRIAHRSIQEIHAAPAHADHAHHDFVAGGVSAQNVPGDDGRHRRPQAQP